MTVRLERRGFLAAGAVLLALAFVAPPSGAADCDDWNAKWFFASVSVADVRDCLAGGADPNARDDKHGWTQLQRAAIQADSLGVVEALLAAGADPNSTAADGSTPLHAAAMVLRDLATVEALLAAGADPNAAPADGFTPLHVVGTAAPVLPPMLDLALQLAPDWARDLAVRWAPDWAGAFSPAPDFVALLVEAGADPNAQDVDGWTPLHGTSVLGRDPAVIAALVEVGADPERAGRGRLDPASRCGGVAQNAAMVEALLDAGADPAARDVDGETPLHYAARRAEHGASLVAQLDDEGLRGWKRMGQRGDR